MANTNEKTLVIVESPAKSKTIGKILGSNYLIKASMGHVRDLASKGLGFDIENNFKPTFEVIPEKKKVITELNKIAKTVDRIYLASDPESVLNSLKIKSLELYLMKLLQMPLKKLLQTIIKLIC